jgi:hypothetical protein
VDFATARMQVALKTTTFGLMRPRRDLNLRTYPSHCLISEGTGVSLIGAGD